MRLRCVFIYFLAWMVHGQSVLAESTNAPNPELLAYSLRMTVDAYENAGCKDPKWNAEATNCLRIYATMLAVTNHSEDQFVPALNKSLRLLQEAKCNDPLIHYLGVQFGFLHFDSPSDKATALWEVADALNKMDYPDAIKFTAYMTTYYALVNADPKDPDVEPSKSAAIRLLSRTLRDKSMPEAAADDLCHFLMLSVAPGDYRKRWDLYQRLQPVLDENWPHASFALLQKGEAYLAYTWVARGTGWASTISEENSKLMEQRLEIADKSLEEAWNSNPRDPRICLAMVRVKVLEGERDALELWFRRGMKLDPAYYDLCWEKLNYLRPRWYGSHAEMLAFGKECATNTNWSGTVPVILSDCHWAICGELSREEQAGYWKRPEVWADIKLSYDRLFTVSPKMTGYRHNYASYAYRTAHWQVFLDQTKLFPWTNYAYFGGVERFNDMVKTAQENVKKITD